MRALLLPSLCVVFSGCVVNSGQIRLARAPPFDELRALLIEVGLLCIPLLTALFGLLHALLLETLSLRFLGRALRRRVRTVELPRCVSVDVFAQTALPVSGAAAPPLPLLRTALRLVGSRLGQHRAPFRAVAQHWQTAACVPSRAQMTVDNSVLVPCPKA